jgi:hypothetical protein
MIWLFNFNKKKSKSNLWEDRMNLWKLIW